MQHILLFTNCIPTRTMSRYCPEQGQYVDISWEGGFQSTFDLFLISRLLHWNTPFFIYVDLAILLVVLSIQSSMKGLYSSLKQFLLCCHSLLQILTSIMSRNKSHFK